MHNNLPTSMFGAENSKEEALSEYNKDTGVKKESDSFVFGQTQRDAEGKPIKNEEYGIGEEESSEDL